MLISLLRGQFAMFKNLYLILVIHTGCAISFATTYKQAGSKYVKDNENQFYSILSDWKSKILYEKFWSFVLFSAQYYEVKMKK